MSQKKSAKTKDKVQKKEVRKRKKQFITKLIVITACVIPLILSMILPFLI